MTKKGEKNVKVKGGKKMKKVKSEEDHQIEGENNVKQGVKNAIEQKIEGEHEQGQETVEEVEHKGKI